MNRLIEYGIVAAGAVAVYNFAGGLRDYCRARKFLIEEYARYAASPGNITGQERKGAESALRMLPFGGGAGARIAARRFRAGKFEGEIIERAEAIVLGKGRK